MGTSLDKYATDKDGIKIERIFGWTVVLSLHIIAGGALLLPLSAAKPEPSARSVVQVRILEPIVEPPPPPPPPPEEIKEVVIAPPKKTPPRPVPKPSPPQFEAPIEDAPARDIDIAVDPTPPAPKQDIAPPAPKPSPPSGGILVAVVAPPPPYPPAALRAGATGTVVLQIEVGPDGNPTEVRIKKSSGNRDLDRAAQQHIRARWKFQATGTSHIGILPVDFKLN